MAYAKADRRERRADAELLAICKRELAAADGPLSHKAIMRQAPERLGPAERQRAYGLLLAARKAGDGIQQPSKRKAAYLLAEQPAA